MQNRAEKMEEERAKAPPTPPKAAGTPPDQVPAPATPVQPATPKPGAAAPATPVPGAPGTPEAEMRERRGATWRKGIENDYRGAKAN